MTNTTAPTAAPIDAGSPAAGRVETDSRADAEGAKVVRGVEVGVSNGDDSLGRRLRRVIGVWAHSQHRLVVLAAEFADTGEWAADGSPTPAHWLADMADVETCTAREWIRIGHKLKRLPAIASAFADGTLSYSKVRALTRVANPDNETELLAIASDVSAGDLGLALAAWLTRNCEPDELEQRQQQARSVKWRTEPDGMVTFTLRLPPLLAGALIAMLTTIVMKTVKRQGDNVWPTAAQQHSDALEQIITAGCGPISTEVVVHVRADGNSLDDGTPIAGTIVERIAPESFIRALIHDISGDPVDATNRRRHPNTRQKRVVKERDEACVDCGRGDLLQYDHNPPFRHTGHTLTTELKLRCAPCHHKQP